MSHNVIDLDDLHKMFTDAGIEHYYTHGDLVISVFHGVHVWTVSEDRVIYWDDVCEPPCRLTSCCQPRYYEFTRTSDAYDYIMDVYSKAE